MLRHHSLEVCRAGGKCSSLAHFYSFSSKSRVWNNTEVRRESSEKTVLQKELHPYFSHRHTRQTENTRKARCEGAYQYSGGRGRRIAMDLVLMPVLATQ